LINIKQNIATLGELGRHVQIDVDVVRYQMNIISHMRIHRAVGGGISPTATQHFDQLVKSLAPLHGIDYVTPALVALALKKVYLHRIQMVSVDQERSMQWGSRADVVKAYLGDFSPEDVMDDVLDTVSAPL
jgi:MoxR-like ATPase